MTSTPPADWWFCNEPGREEARARIDKSTGRVIGQWYTCQHGTWPDLTEARKAHSITVEPPALPSP